MMVWARRWQDDYPDSWEPEESVSSDIIALWEQQQHSDAYSEQQKEVSNGNGSSHRAMQLEAATA